MHGNITITAGRSCFSSTFGRSFPAARKYVFFFWCVRDCRLAHFIVGNGNFSWYIKFVVQVSGSSKKDNYPLAEGNICDSTINNRATKSHWSCQARQLWIRRRLVPYSLASSNHPVLPAASFSSRLMGMQIFLFLANIYASCFTSSFVNTKQFWYLNNVMIQGVLGLLDRKTAWVTRTVFSKTCPPLELKSFSNPLKKQKVSSLGFKKIRALLGLNFFEWCHDCVRSGYF